MTREKFIKRLLEIFGENTGDVFSNGLENGWLEFEDKLFRDDAITRKNIARIIHLYLLKEKGISDLKDISKAAELRDLYDCRVCANHVAQVYLRDIMSAKELSVNGGFLWFDLNGEDDSAAIEDYLIRAYEITKNV